MDAEQFCSRHKLPAWDTRLVVWLVENHLVMSTTAQRKDLSDPQVINDFAQLVGDETHLDYLYVLTVAVVIAALASIGSVKTTWTFSAFTVLVYYAVTNLAAIRLPAEQRFYSVAWAWCGLAACLALPFAVEREVWLTGLGVLGVGLAWHWTRRRFIERGEIASSHKES